MAIYRGVGGSSQTSGQATIDEVTTLATQAATSATNAASSATTASGHASTASGYATNASNSATSAATSATASASSATAAASSATSAAASYDAFDDRYLGAKASDPTTDNDGDALVTGALYFNTTSNLMKVYTDADTWITTYASLGDAISNVVEDTTPQLGGTLDANGNDIDMGVNTITDTKVGQWDTAYGWGNHASAGYLTSETSHADVVVDGDFATAGIMATNGLGVYSIVTDNSTNWNTAYGWGDHASAGYLTSLAINGVSDITITTPADNEVLAYDNTSGTWINQTASEAGLATTTDITNMLESSDIGVTVQAYDVDILKADVADTITAPMRGTVTTDNDLSFDMNVTNNFKATPTGTPTLTFTNITAGQSGNIWLDNSAGATISAATTTYISAADLSTISTAGVYFMSYYSDGTNVAVSVTQAITSQGA